MVINLRCFVLVMVMELCLIPARLMGADPAVIQTPPTTAHHFFDARNISIFSINALIMAADVATTRRALQVPGAHVGQSPDEKSRGGHRHESGDPSVRGWALPICSTRADITELSESSPCLWEYLPPLPRSIMPGFTPSNELGQRIDDAPSARRFERPTTNHQ